ncbi:acyl-CoA thioesterase [Dietzia sp. NCCP-2495]|uniref:acyl-CoA thioesterase n=1 Tax=Dietzia sp. NCCP-2495 TaxID=2934675 RepID=UPI0022322ED9|nr:thioesterase family protein [Dietzia sp. NCCP-2495]GLB63003.1 acyl-CoA thioesterase [Dietzia sp. NCCP-2495]
MSLTSMLEAASRGGTIEVDQGWAQGRAIFGGLTGALLLSAMKGRVAEAAASAGNPAAVPPLRSISVSFIGPATPGTVEIEAEVLRVGSNVTQCQATLRQSGEVVAVALAAFGKHRESTLAVEPTHPFPELPEPSSVEAFPYVEKLTPEFYRFAELRQVGGEMPFSGASSNGISGWTGLRERPQFLTEEHVVLLADAWPPAPLQMVEGFAPGSSLTWTLELIAEIGTETVPGSADLAYQSTTDSARDGYAHTHAMLWLPSGELAAISRQSITIFA